MDDRVIRTVLQRMLAHRGYDLAMPYQSFPPAWEAWVHCLTCRHTILVKKGRFFNLSLWTDDTVHDPNWSVWDVVRSSMSYPVCLAPQTKDGHVFVDGMTSIHSYTLMPEYVRFLVQQGETPLWLALGTEPPVPPTDTLSFLAAIFKSQWVEWNDSEFRRWHRDV